MSSAAIFETVLSGGGDAVFGKKVDRFNLGAITFDPGMAKRTGQGPFAVAPIIQGDFPGDVAGDVLRTQVPTTITGQFADIVDLYQGSLVFWITPEWDGNDNKDHWIWFAGLSNFYLRKNRSNDLQFVIAGAGTSMTVAVDGWNAGDTHCVVLRWDTKNTLDGSNYMCISIDDVHTFDVSTAPDVSGSIGYMRIGSINGLDSANAIIEGLTVYRRPLFDGTYGIDVGNSDELAAIYAAGSGLDPAQVTGSWDITFCLPTDQSVGNLATGTGEAWSHPHGSNVVEHGWFEDGGYVQRNIGSPYAVTFDADGFVDHGSDASLDDLQDDAVTFEGWFKLTGGRDQRLFVKRNAGLTTGYDIYYLNSAGVIRALINCATTDAESRVSFTPDDKWHHFTIFFDDAGDRQIYIAIDGKWASSYVAQTAGAGAISSDAANDLNVGNYVSGAQVEAAGWYRISDNDRHSHGTDFQPPYAVPGSDAQTVLLVYADEGTGTTLDNEQGDANRDGTLTNGTWEKQWAQEGQPSVPTFLSFDGSADFINCGSDAALDDLHGADFTAEAWIVWSGEGGTNQRVVSKSAGGAEGWFFRVNDDGSVLAVLNYQTTSASRTAAAGTIEPGKLYHIAMTCTFATRTVQLWINGVDFGSNNGSGAVASDAAGNLNIGRRNNNSEHFNGTILWVRLSDNVRYSAAFNVPSAFVPPASDANTIAVWQLEEGAGTTADNAEGTAALDGTISGATWYTTPDLETVAPGERVYNWGYAFGGANANWGFYQRHSGLTVGQDYVLRLVVSATQQGVNVRLRIWDNTNGAEVSSDNFGADATKEAPGVSLITFELPTAARGAAADCTDISVRITTSGVNSDVIIHQLELLENLIDNPSVETGSGNPWIPDGWTNTGLDAGDTEEENAIVHSGGSSVEWNVGAAAEQMGQTITVVTDRFYSFGMWQYGDATITDFLAGSQSANAQLHNSDTDRFLTLNSLAAWTFYPAVYRANAVSFQVYVFAGGGAVGDRFTDDHYLFELDDVTLTATPASQANSLEGGGIRVDGYDDCTQPLLYAKADKGEVQFAWIPRHSGADMLKFGESLPHLFRIQIVGEYIYGRFTGASFLTLQLNDATGTLSAAWNTASVIVGQVYAIKVAWGVFGARLYVDGVERINISSRAVAFTSDPTEIMWGAYTLGNPNFQGDAVFR